MSLNVIHVAHVVEEELGMRLSIRTRHCFVQHGFRVVQIDTRVEIRDVRDNDMSDVGRLGYFLCSCMYLLIERSISIKQLARCIFI